VRHAHLALLSHRRRLHHWKHHVTMRIVGMDRKVYGRRARGA
jgi:hypothetical protein